MPPSQQNDLDALPSTAVEVVVRQSGQNVKSAFAELAFEVHKGREFDHLFVHRVVSMQEYRKETFNCFSQVGLMSNGFILAPLVKTLGPVHDNSLRNMHHPPAESKTRIFEELLQKLKSLAEILHIEIVSIRVADGDKGIVFMVKQQFEEVDVLGSGFRIEGRYIMPVFCSEIGKQLQVELEIDVLILHNCGMVADAPHPVSRRECLVHGADGFPPQQIRMQTSHVEFGLPVGEIEGDFLLEDCQLYLFGERGRVIVEHMVEEMLEGVLFKLSEEHVEGAVEHIPLGGEAGEQSHDVEVHDEFVLLVQTVEHCGYLPGVFALPLRSHDVDEIQFQLVVNSPQIEHPQHLGELDEILGLCDFGG